MIPLFWPQIYKEEWLGALEEVFSGRWIGQGPLVDQFEEEFGAKFGYGHCLAVNSGTSALELAYHLIGVGPGDEVITPVLTCTATNIPLVRRGARIVFADIGNDLTISYEDVAAKASRDTKAIVVVTLGGLPVDPRIFDLAEEFKVPVVVDAAQSLGVREGRGDYVCYSFQAIKHFTTGDGGMLVSRHRQDHTRAKKLRWFGIDREAKRRADWRCMVNHQMAMQIEEAGYKYHMNDIAAALGIVGLRYSDEILAHRRALCGLYAELLPPEYGYAYGGACWMFAILTDSRDEVMGYLRGRGVECDLVQLRNDLFWAFGGRRRDLPNMDRLEGRYLYLPLHGRLTSRDVAHITGLLNIRERGWKKSASTR